jgi:hypothetical protein
MTSISHVHSTIVADEGLRQLHTDIPDRNGRFPNDPEYQHPHSRIPVLWRA